MQKRSRDSTEKLLMFSCICAPMISLVLILTCVGMIYNQNEKIDKIQEDIFQLRHDYDLQPTGGRFEYRLNKIMHALEISGY